jgi:hypothetical protein
MLLAMNVSAALRAARIGAGLSQDALARRARTSQSAIARYESGATAPSLRTLQRLIEACGRRLEDVLTEPTQAMSALDRVPHRDRLTRSRRGILTAARRHGIRRVRLFGSVARGTAGAGSDVDLLVELSPRRTLVDLIGFQQDVAEAIGVPVDVATPEILKPQVRRRALRDARPL